MTSSPRYPQSNGKAENAVKTVKRLFSKCQAVGQSEFRALLDWRNTPTEGIGTSPAQRFMGRRCRTQLPLTETQLKPAFPTDGDTRALQGQKARQQHYYNRHVRELPPISAGEAVRMRLPGEKKWTSGICTGPVGPRSYGVKVGEAEFRRNRRQLLHTSERPEIDIPAQESEQVPNHLPTDEDTQAHSEPDPQLGCSTQPLRRSERIRKPPDWITTYVPS